MRTTKENAMKRKSTGDTKKIRFEMTAEPGSQVFVA
jgi:hypothetical protein